MPASEFDQPFSAASDHALWSFGHRFLLDIADNASPSDYWDQYSTHSSFNIGEVSQELSFQASSGGSSDDAFVQVSMETIRPFDSSWKIDAIREYTQIDGLTSYMEGDEGVYTFPEEHAEIYDDSEFDEEMGYFGVIHEYTFSIPYSVKSATAHKSMSITFYDEDKCPVDSEVGYHFGLFRSVPTAEELELLADEAVPLTDFEELEKTLPEVTDFDLGLIVSWFRKFKLIP